MSGFYGPVTWAGWLLTLASSWYMILYHPEQSATADITPRLLYTNYGAIDALRLSITVLKGGVIGSLYRGSIYDSYSTAVTVTARGLLRTNLQIVFSRVHTLRTATRRLCASSDRLHFQRYLLYRSRAHGQNHAFGTRLQHDHQSSLLHCISPGTACNA
jgi:hypothetical protein